MTEPSATVRVELTSDELELVRAALNLLQSTLGREEADELQEVQAILAKLPEASRERAQSAFQSSP